MTKRAEITTTTSGGTIVLDGQKIPGVRAYTLTGVAGELHTLTLDFFILRDGKFEADVKCGVAEKTHDALIALGWTPPAE